MVVMNYVNHFVMNNRIPPSFWTNIETLNLQSIRHRYQFCFELAASIGRMHRIIGLGMLCLLVSLSIYIYIYLSILLPYLSTICFCICRPVLYCLFLFLSVLSVLSASLPDIQSPCFSEVDSYKNNYLCKYLSRARSNFFFKIFLSR